MKTVRDRDGLRKRFIRSRIVKKHSKNNPQNIAVQTADGATTYGELNELSDKVAIYLKKRGIGTEDKIGILMERSANVLVSMFGILKANAAYVPLNTGYPPSRIRYMAENSQLKLIITRDKYSELVNETGIEFSSPHEILNPIRMKLKSSKRKISNRKI